jgi:hypothetical protein
MPDPITIACHIHDLRPPKRSVSGLRYRGRLMEINAPAASQSEQSGLMGQAIVCPGTVFARSWFRLVGGTRCLRPAAMQRCTVTGR